MGIFVSDTINFPCVVELTQAVWSVDVPLDGGCEISIRVSTDGISFTDWVRLYDNNIPEEYSRCVAMQYRVRLVQGSSLISPVFHHIEFTYLMDIPSARIISPHEPNMITSCQCQLLQYIITSGSPPFVESARVMINGVIFGPDGFSLRADTLSFTPSYPCFENGEIVRTSLINLINTDGCGIREGIERTFLVDLTPPEITGTNPAPGSMLSGE
ncbi:MAG: hypothetical protein ACPL6C_02685, partial [bacterium]